MTCRAVTCRLVVPLVVLGTIALVDPSVARAEPSNERHCYSVKESRDAVRENALPEPLTVFRNIATGANASILGVVLCRTRNRLVYEVKLLGRDGRITRSIVDPFGRPVTDP